LLRHGQAGQRDHYDQLSEIGLRQASALGEHLRHEQARFDLCIIGGLRRQRETAQAVIDTLAPRRVETDPRWNEFDIDGVFAGIVPQLAAVDPEFRTGWEALQARIAGGDTRAHREWTPIDSRVVEAWVERRFPFAGESWLEFTARVRAAAAALAALPDDAHVAVFTSAAPISVLVADTFGDALPQRILSMAGSMWNASISALNTSGGATLLWQFNAIPHLADPALRTVR
jgi:broad specificity phosphatase PhoE